MHVLPTRLPGLLGLLLGGLAMAGCNEDLDLIAANQCGNKVLEPLAGEDCDGEANCHPAGAHGACRFACNPEADCPDGCDPEPGCVDPAPCCPGGLACCPSGFACGVDSVCRQPSGAFVIADASSTPTLGLSLGDLEHDGRVDVVRLSRDTTSVHFYDDDLTPALVETIMGGPSLPVVGDLTNDERPDLALRVFMGTDHAGGVAVLRTQADRSLASTIFSAITLVGVDNARFAVIDALPPATPREILQFSDDAARCIVPGTGMGVLQDGLADASGLVGVAVGNFDEDAASSPCEEAAYAYGGATQIALLESCEPDPAHPGEFQFATEQQLPPVRLPPGFELFETPPESVVELSVAPLHRQRLFAVHWNGGDTPPADWHLDLVIVTRESGSSSSAPRLHLAYGVGDGTFHSTVPVPPAAGDGVATSVSVPYEGDDGEEGVAFASGSSSSGVPLVLADFNDDEAIDFACSKLLLVSDPGGEAPYRRLLSDTRWSAAVSRDFNGNGTLDLVAARQGRSGLDFLDGTGEGTFSLSALPSERAVSHLAVGDFDGDLLADVVFAHPAAAQADSDGSSEDDDGLYVSFGRPAGSPELPVKLGELRSIEQVVPGAIRSSDSAEEILILARSFPGTADPLRGGIVIGNGDRQLHAPFIFQPIIDGPRTTMPIWVAHGRFFAGEGVVGLGVMTQDPPNREDPDIEGSYRVWLARSTGDQAELSASTTGASAQESTGLVCEGCAVAVVDLGEDHIDELITLGPNLEGEGPGGLLSVYEVVPGEGFERTAEHATSLSFPDVRERSTVVRPIVRDIDRDGRQDIALTAGSVVVVFWNDGTSDLAQQWASEQASVTRIEIPDGEELNDIALLDADDDRELELVVLTTSGVRLLQLVGARQWQSFEDGEVLADPTATGLLAGGDVIAAGDLDGDGVEDLVIGDASSYRALKGQAVRP